MDYPQELIDTLRNLIKAHEVVSKEQDEVIAAQKTVIEYDRDLIAILRAQIKILKGE